MRQFADIIHCDDDHVCRALQAIDYRDVAIALSGAGQDVRRKIFRNLTPAGQRSIERLEVDTGPAVGRDVARVRQRISQLIAQR